MVRHHSSRTNERLIRHEQIHIQQQVELLVIPFYLLYFTEFLIRWLISLNFDKAYRTISFEREAFDFDNDESYLQRRKKFGMWRS